MPVSLVAVYAVARKLGNVSFVVFKLGGTTPPDQFDGSLQLPPAVFVQVCPRAAWTATKIKSAAMSRAMGNRRVMGWTPPEDGTCECHLTIRSDGARHKKNRPFQPTVAGSLFRTAARTWSALGIDAASFLASTRPAIITVSSL